MYMHPIEWFLIHVKIKHCFIFAWWIINDLIMMNLNSENQFQCIGKVFVDRGRVCVYYMIRILFKMSQSIHTKLIIFNCAWSYAVLWNESQLVCTFEWKETGNWMQNLRWTITEIVSFVSWLNRRNF